jgi:hypothetical protein
VVVDGRARLRKDGAMASYFGNVLTIPYGVARCADLRGTALADAAGDVHRWVAEAATGDHFRELVDWVEAQRPEPTVARAYLGRGGLRGVVGPAAAPRGGGLRVGPAGVRVVPLPLARRRWVCDADAQSARGRGLGGVRARDAGGGGGHGGTHGVQGHGGQLHVLRVRGSTCPRTGWDGPGSR